MHLGRTLIGAACACGLLAAAVVSGCTKNEARPSIVLITLDTTRADHLGVYGYEPSPSPNLDRFATNAVVYDRAYSASSWTLPSHASMFTGLLPSQHGAGSPLTAAPGKWRYTPLLDDFTTLAELLGQAGYRTAAVIGGAAMDPELGLSQGFEHYESDFRHAMEKFNGKRADFIADRGIAYLEQFGDEPYFLFLNFFDPHRPYRPPGPAGKAVPAPNPAAEKSMMERIGDVPRPPSDLDPAVTSALAGLRSGYDAEIHYMDEHLGRLLAAIEALPRERRPIVAITSDHGESFGEHYYLLHGTHLYEDNTRVPLIVHDPRRPIGERVDDPVLNQRLFATLLEAAGIEPPAPADPRTLASTDAPVITELWRTEIAIGFLGERAARDLRTLHDPPYKLIESSDGSYELYDLDADPDELVNLADDEPELAASMKKKLYAAAGDGKPLFEAGEQIQLSEKTREALRALGYLQ